MKIGMIGLGKLGLPTATAIRSRGHEVLGYDVADARRAAAGSEFLAVALTIEEVVASSEIVFVAVQTPHVPEFEGITRLPFERKDFDYTWLQNATEQIGVAVRDTGASPVVAVISTALPGTMERVVKPMLCGAPMVYNPSFITMGHVEEDFLNPEFVLLGVDDPAAAAVVETFYRTIADAPVLRMGVKDAELTKVLYNAALTVKLTFANVATELCHRTGCDADAVLGALRSSTRRIASSAYLEGGMGEGGPCRPRDAIALSWLSREAGMSYDLFEQLMFQREAQAEWLADLMGEYPLPKVIFGTAYKPDVDIETGSHALLVRNILIERGHEVWVWDPGVPAVANASWPARAVYLIANRRPEFRDYPFAEGSVIIDPWRWVRERPGITVIGIGRPRDRRVPVLRQ